MPPHNNRDRLEVRLGEAWRLYAGDGWPRPGWEMLGVVADRGSTGALARSPFGSLWQVNAGALRSLNQRKALAALAAVKREESA